MLAAFDLAPLFPWGSVEVHTIGAPRPGNAAFAKVRHFRLCPWQLHALLLQLCDPGSRHCLATPLLQQVPLGNWIDCCAPLKPAPHRIWLAAGPATLALGASC